MIDGDVLHDRLVLTPLIPAGDPAGRAVLVLGVVAMIAWLAALVLVAVSRSNEGRRTRSRDLAWAASLLGLGCVAGALGAGQPGWHVILIGVTAGVALRNAALCAGAARFLTLLGLLAWVLAIARARLLFGA